VKDLEDKFVEVEKRVQALVSENADLRKRVSGLERELAGARRESRELENFHGKRMHIREKIERILHTLEAAGEKK
jgi:predicted  nucleic acid-binding Zn-ribbon protein